MFGDFDRFLMRIESKLNDTRYDFLLKPRKRNTSASLSAMLRDFVGLGAQKVAVTVHRPVLCALRCPPHGGRADRPPGIRVQLLEPEVREFPILLVCEEAHAYIPRASESQFAGSRKSMERIAKEGASTALAWRWLASGPTRFPKPSLRSAGHSSAYGSRTQKIRATSEASSQRAKATWSAFLRA